MVNHVRALLNLVARKADAQKVSSVYLSVGSRISPDQATTEKIKTQQLPTHIVKDKSIVILIDPSRAWSSAQKVDEHPLIMNYVNEYMLIKKFRQTDSIWTYEFGNVILYRVNAFADEQDLISFVKKVHNKVKLTVGDFLVTGPYIPFDMFPALAKTLTECKVKVALSAVRERFDFMQ